MDKRNLKFWPFALRRPSTISRPSLSAFDYTHRLPSFSLISVDYRGGRNGWVRGHVRQEVVSCSFGASQVRLASAWSCSSEACLAADALTLA